MYPNNGQIQAIAGMLEECRWLYNWALDCRKLAWEHMKEHVNYYDQANLLPYLKEKVRPNLTGVQSQVLQDVLRRVDKAFKAFFRRAKSGEKPGYPRFRGKDRYDSITYPQNPAFRIEKTGLRCDKLVLSKIGAVRCRVHRDIPDDAVTKTCTISRSGDRWFASITYDVPDADVKEIISENVVGLDLGLNHLLAFSDGVFLDAPKWFRASEKKLGIEQRRLSRKKRRSKNRSRQRLRVSAVHRKIHAQRKDFMHKTSRSLVDSFDGVVMEDLRIKNMVRNHHLSKSIHDAGWNMFAGFVAYKAEEAGKHAVFVNPSGTSIECCVCGTPVSKTLSVRTHRCPSCGLVLDRDTNAAVNILGRGLDALGLLTAGTAGRACLNDLVTGAMIQEAPSSPVLAGREG